MLGVPLHGSDVAPRFCSADQFLIAELDGDRISRVRRLEIPDESWSKRLKLLSIAGVNVLLCGGFNRSFLPVAEGLGIRVITGLTGEAEQLIDAFLRNDLDRFRFLPCRGRRGRRHCWERPRQSPEAGLSRRKGVETCSDTTGSIRREVERAREGGCAIAAGWPAKRQ
jgi:predicted Fe-Mo cluster-binding NifX family protein